MPTDLRANLTRIVTGLEPSSPAARRAIYDKAREALKAEIRAAAPFLPVHTALAKTRELEELIKAVEAEAAQHDPPPARRVAHRPTPSASPPAPVATSPPPVPPGPVIPSGPVQGSQAEEILTGEPVAMPAHAATADDEQPARKPQARSMEALRLELERAVLARPEWPFVAEPVIENGLTKPEVPEQADHVVAELDPVRRGSITYFFAVAGVALIAVLTAVFVGSLLGDFTTAGTQTPAPLPASGISAAEKSRGSEIIESAGFNIAAKQALHRGNELIARRDYDGAIEAFSDAIRLDPSNVEGRLSRAVAYNRTGEYQLAVNDLDHVIAVGPANPDALISRCQALALLQHLQEALADCNEAARLRPGDPNVLDSRGFVNLRLGQLERAIVDYSDALKREPGRASALYGRGLARIGRGDRAGGNEDVAAARAVDPQIQATFARYGVR